MAANVTRMGPVVSLEGVLIVTVRSPATGSGVEAAPVHLFR